MLSILYAQLKSLQMLLSTGMLILLACLFVWPAYTIFIAPKIRTDKDPGGFRDSLVRNLTSFFEAISIFTLSILVSTIIYLTRDSVDSSVYNIFMAEVLSFVGSTLMVMVAASICQHLSRTDDKNQRSQQHASAIKEMLLNPFGDGATLQEKPQLGSKHIYIFVLNTLLTIVLFVLEVAIRHADPNQGLLAEKRCLTAVPGHTDLGKKAAIPISFSLWMVALIGSIFQFFGLLYPDIWSQRRSKAHMLRLLAVVPMIFGTAALVWLVYLFCRTWKDMRIAFGRSFVDGEQDWTFGQCMAVFTWCSPLLAVVQAVAHRSSRENSVRCIYRLNRRDIS